MHILILGNASDAHAVHLNTALTQAGAVVDYFDTGLFPTHLCLSWDPQTSNGSLRLPAAHPLALRDIHSVFWRTLRNVGTVPLADAQQQRLASNDAMSTLHTLIKACPARWINSWQAYQFHREKPLQLRAIHHLGVQIPPTLVTNDPADVRRFAQSHARVIFKPVYGGAHTRVLTPTHLAPPRLELALQLAPITLQAYIPGTNIRSYVLGDAVYAAEIRSASLDFRDDSQAAVLPVVLPADVQEQCRGIARTLFLTWTAIDWRLTPRGDYVFLEANPSPMFLHFERRTGFPITQELVHLLME
jgi:glutathione synthase/RimK-type ligase-like ATP-grasp enzyme